MGNVTEIKLPDLSKCSAIFIDLDNTIFDTRTDIKNAIIRECEAEGIEFKQEVFEEWKVRNRAAIYKKYLGFITQEELLRLRGEVLVDTFGLRITPAEGTELTMKSIREGYTLLPRVVETLQKLSQRRPLALASNGILDIQRPRLVKTDVIGYFSHLFVSDTVGSQKPSREFFDYALEKMMLPAERVLMIGDEIGADIVGAKRAGLMTCYVINGSSKDIPEEADYFVNDFCDLLAIL